MREYYWRRAALLIFGVSFAIPSLSAATLPITNGLFAFPNPASCVCSGVGTNTFYNGAGDPTVVSFIGLSFNPIIDVGPDGARFQIGTLYLANGATKGGTEATSVVLGVGAVSSGSGFAYLPSQFTIDFTFTPNVTGDPYLDRDFFTIETVGTLSVDEGSTAMVPLLAKVYPLIGPLVAAGPVDTRQYGITIDGFGTPTGGGHIESQVPEPQTVMLVISGLIALSFAIRRFRLRYEQS